MQRLLNKVRYYLAEIRRDDLMLEAYGRETRGQDGYELHVVCT